LGGFLVGVGVLALACTSTVPPSSPARSPLPLASVLISQSPDPSPSPPNATLVVHGRGTIACMTPHGCLASFVLGPADWTPPEDWEPSLDDLSFSVTDDPKRIGTRLVNGPVDGVPPTIDVGPHTIVAAVSEVSDLASLSPDNGSLVFGYLWTQTCQAGVDVRVITQTVTLDVVFEGSQCRITVRQE